MKKLPYLLLTTVCALSACRGGPTVDSIIFAPAPLEGSGAVLRLYRKTLPACAFEEIGLVRAQHGSLEQMASAIRERALEMGGHAIVGLSQAESSTPGQTQVTTTVPDSGSVVSTASFSMSQVTTLSGTVIRFVEPSCRR